MAKDKLRKVGDVAPEFHLYEADGRKISLSDLLGENKYVLLYFTSSEEKSRCDRSGCPLKENLEKLMEYDVIPVLIDKDPIEEHKRFKHDHGIKFLMLSDPTMETIKGYGVYEKVNVHGIEKEKIVSTAFLINPEGRIVHVWEPKRIEESIDDIINAIKKLKGM